jgi:hypothetical protein
MDISGWHCTAAGCICALGLSVPVTMAKPKKTSPYEEPINGKRHKKIVLFVPG